MVYHKPYITAYSIIPYIPQKTRFLFIAHMTSHSGGKKQHHLKKPTVNRDTGFSPNSLDSHDTVSIWDTIIT